MKQTMRNFQQVRQSTRGDFVSKLTSELSERLRGFQISEQQIDAWALSFGWIYDSISRLSDSTDSWLLFPEFNPPLSPIRPDLVIATGDCTVIIEFKAGNSKIGNTSRKQTRNYASEMHNTMTGVRDSTIYAVLVSPSISATKIDSSFLPWNSISDYLNEINPNNIDELFKELISKETGKLLNVGDWMNPTYDLHPDIVWAASELIAHVEDRGVITHLSDDEELDAVRGEVIALINDARKKSQKRVVLISGVPGAGKTLVGLRLAHDPDLHDSLPANSGTPLYLTGNGPLVDVLVEAVARDDKRRNPEKTMGKARREAGSKIKLVHGITENSLPIDTRVVVFDEGQRVWTADHMKAKGKAQVNMSEGEVILATLERSREQEVEWSVLVVLIGTGQEINRGEAGASVWAEAVSKRNLLGKDWDIFGPEQLRGELGQSANISKNLHLEVSRRALSASSLSQWVAFFLSGNFDKAKDLRDNNEQLKKFPIFVTRDLEVARNWIREKANRNDIAFRPSSGIVASSKSARLRAYGLEVGNQPRNSEVDWKRWFLDDPVSLHASSRLEVAASEFKTQGLELDYVCVAWSWDLIVNSDGSWSPRRVDKSKAKWSYIKKDRQFLINSYRVLLTRCRRGMIIFVPEGNENDPSLNPTEINSVYKRLLQAGATTLE